MVWTERAVSRENGSDDGRAVEAGPVHLGYHVFDAQTGLLLIDGARASLGGDCKPGEKCEATAEIQLPPEEGRYHVVISPVEEQVGWFYECGSEFVFLEVASSPENVTVQRVQRTTRARMRARRILRSLLRAFWYPLRTLTHRRSLIFSMVRRDVLGRYRGSFGGALWTILHPLLLMLAYYFVFSVVLRVRFRAEQGSAGFVLYFLCGMLPWMAFSEAVGRSATTVMDHGNFVKRVLFPLEILPLNLTLAGLVTEFFGLLLFLVALVALGAGIPATAAYFPLVLVPQFLLTVGLCWFLAALGVFLRDTGHILGFLLTVWFFITPICYPATALPESYLWLFEKNPMYAIVGAYRAIMLENSPPDWGPLATLWVVSVAAFFGGHAWFYKVKKSFADLI